MSSLLRHLASLSDGLMKAEGMKWLRPIFSPLSISALKRAIEEDIDVLAYAWASMPEEVRRMTEEDAKQWAGVVRSIGETQVLRWLNEEFPQHVALIKEHPKGPAWVGMLLASMRKQLLGS